jgi:hypothetical protein
MTQNIIDNKNATKNKYLSLDASRNTIKLSNFLISKCLEETGESSQADINLHLENSQAASLFEALICLILN